MKDKLGELPLDELETGRPRHLDAIVLRAIQRKGGVAVAATQIWEAVRSDADPEIRPTQMLDSILTLSKLSLISWNEVDKSASIKQDL